jgi:molybdenum cofactor cytidylyltransferase
MKFGSIPIAEAAGSVAAHTVRAGEAIVRKGATISVQDAEKLAAGGLTEIVAVQLEPGDIDENTAAEQLARAIAGCAVVTEAPFTGRVNLFAAAAGVLTIDTALIDMLNGIDEAITVATLPALKAVVAGEMIGTVKIIPYAVPGAVLERALAGASRGAGDAVRVAAYARRRIAVVSTLLPGLKPSVVRKTLDVLGERLAPAEAAIVREARVPHEAGALTQELVGLGASEAELIVVFGASAIADRRDVIPAAIEAAGGRVEQAGDRRAGLRALAQGERLRLGAAPAARRRAGDP